MIADRAMVGGKDAGIFKPQEILEPNLTGVGMEGKHPAVKFNIAINDYTRELMNKALIHLGN